MINNVVLVGRLTKDPELRSTASGASVVTFSLAVNRGFQSSDGQDADFIQCTAWNKTAENMEKYLSKGPLIGIEGRIQTRNYENGQGQRVYVTEVYCNRVQFLETKKSSEEYAPKPQARQTQSYTQHTQRDNFDAYDGVDSFDDIDDEDIGF